ncbi:MAG: fatty acid kinase fatty acid binding subunit [Bacillota bacterium]|jgi:DegV family protein with EDD domain|nr:fatty acid kinase fatty acid binding subunit [Bacillota bacterium]MDK2856521.1 fatty acid kinase fatty acid binding subunit [Bacillota bacterium]MDK2926023.1 fatty acid kinase fatty acid binding subunit [Bacillota bacterium]
MQKIHLVTDSTSYLPREVIEEYGIHVVPLRVNLDGASLREGLDITNAEFFRRLRTARTLPTTSQPPAGEFATLYQELGQDGGSIVSIHISGDLSGTVRAAETARRMLPELDIHILDSRITCLGLGFVVWEAARAVRAGQPLSEVLARARAVIENVTAYFMVDDLNYLHRGGRIGAAQAFVGSLLAVKPILAMKKAEGVISVVDKVRTRKKALERLVELTTHACGGQEKVTATVLDADAKEVRQELTAELQAALPQAEIIPSEFGPVIGTHVGPGAVGVIFYTV